MSCLPQVDVSPPTCYLYHERQHLGLCGMHAINSLMQWPAVARTDLERIAAQMDAAEGKLLTDDDSTKSTTTTTTTVTAKTFDIVDLEHLDDTLVSVRNGDEYGNFSSQVVIAALTHLGFECCLLNDVEYARTDLARDCDALVINHHTHWFCLRTVCGVWYDFNSFLARPVPVEAARLRAYVDELRRKRYTTFVVRGAAPLPAVHLEPPVRFPKSPYGQWLPTVLGYSNRCGCVLRPAQPAAVPLPIRFAPGAAPPASLDSAMAELTATLQRLYQMEKAVHRRLSVIEERFRGVDDAGQLAQVLASVTD